ncbi:MAG TPA: GNAT family N-acetyltransferase, partial [Bauldia sp.]|nr:GNAT family N-acetyltransferase [Bauldia sp.]
MGDDPVERGEGGVDLRPVEERWHRRHRRLEEGRVLVAREGDEIVGHLQLVPTDGPGGVEIKNMAVAPARQRTGVGR